MSHQPSPRRRNGQPRQKTASSPRRHLAQQAVAASPCATACIVQPAACNLDPHHRPVEQKKGGLESIVSPGRQAHKQQTIALNMSGYFPPIPTWTSPQPTPSPMTPFPCSDPGPRSRIPLAHFIPAFVIDSMHASFHLARNNNILEATLLCPSAQTRARPRSLALKHLGWSNIRPTCQNPSPVTPRPLPGPPPPSTSHGGDHHDPHDPKYAIISIAGPGPTSGHSSPAVCKKKTQFNSPPPRSSHLIECGIGPG